MDRDDDEIREAVRRDNPVAIWVTVGVSVAVVLILTTFLALKNRNEGFLRDTATDRELVFDERERSDKEFALENEAVFDFEDRTDEERYTDFEYSGVVYKSTGISIEKSDLGILLGESEVSGFDYQKKPEHRLTADIYEVSNMPREEILAAKLSEGKYVVFKTEELSRPADIVSLIERYHLSDIVIAGYYTEGEKEYRNLTEETSGKIWETLLACSDAVLTEKNEDLQAASTISFSIAYNRMGEENRSLAISSGGLVWTDICGKKYVFDITEEVATELIKYINKKSVVTDFTPISDQDMPATVVSVNEEYICLNDGIGMKDESLGREYRILLSDEKFSRYVKYYEIKAGDKVLLTYDGRIFADNLGEIENPISLRAIK